MGSTTTVGESSDAVVGRGVQIESVEHRLELSPTSFNRGFDIELFGADLDGRQFVEQTRVIVRDRDGVTVVSENKLAPESEVIVRNPVTNEEAVARVIDLIQDADVVRTYGITFIDPSVNLWHIDFPVVQAKETTLMECSRCYVVDAVLLSEIERKIVESRKALRRHCACDNSSTIWKPTDRRVAEQGAVEGGGTDPQTIPPAVEPTTRAAQERRKERRTAMKAVACIRCYGEEVVVECEDVSRGGFRFKSSKAYREETMIEAAVPYAKGNFNIFVSGQIAYQQELSGGFYSHGVAYLRSVKTPASNSL
jgi:hypothetical protein